MTLDGPAALLMFVAPVLAAAFAWAYWVRGQLLLAAVQVGASAVLAVWMWRGFVQSCQFGESECGGSWVFMLLVGAFWCLFLAICFLALARKTTSGDDVPNSLEGRS